MNPTLAAPISGPLPGEGAWPSSWPAAALPRWPAAAGRPGFPSSACRWLWWDCWTTVSVCPAAGRYGIQIVTALALVAISPLMMPWWLVPVAVIAVTAVINFVNFSDGLDGLVAGCMVVLLSVAMLATTQESGDALLPLIGALLSFLAWNWSPARVFMGDVGSTFLGAVFAGMVLQQDSALGALGLLLVGFPLLGDAFLCVLRRWKAGQPVFQAHRLHLYQRLHQAGWAHSRVALLYIGATALLGWALLAHGLALELALAVAVLILGLWLDRHCAVRFTP